MQERIRVLITGQVQGVYFRASTKKEADRLGLIGWVRNLPDGRVELVAEGEQTLLDTLLAWCRQGPPWSRVDDLEVERQPPRNVDHSFDVRY